MTTKVIFRKFKGDVIALFPSIAGTLDYYSTCMSYQHLGQHSSASILINKFPAASPDEFKALLDELVSIGYDDLKIAKRFTHKDLLARKAQTGY